MQKEVYNPEAERAVLGCMIMRPQLIKQTRSLLKCPNDTPFFVANHQKIYDAILYLDECKIQLDRITLLEYLDIDNPDTLLSEIISSVPTTANHEHYCQIVANHEMQRRLINETKLITAELERGADNLTSVKHKLQTLSEAAKHTASFTLDDIGEYWNAPPLTWTFADVLPRNIAAVISSPGGLGKSLIAMGLGLSLATGLTLFPSFRPVDAPAHVLYLSGEDPIEVTRIRLNAYERRYFPSGDYRDAVLKRFHNKSEGTGALIDIQRQGNISPSAYYNHLYAYCEEIKPRLIIVDTLRRALGAANENDNAVVGYTMELITKLARVSNGTALVLSHVSKMGGQSKQVSADDARGASALKDEARTHFIARKLDTGSGLRLTLVKANYSAHNLIGRTWFFGFDGACLVEQGTQDITYAEPKLLLPDIIQFMRVNSSLQHTLPSLTRKPQCNLLLRKLVSKGHDWVTPTHLKDVIGSALESGRLKIEWQNVGGHRKEVVVISDTPVPVANPAPKPYTPNLPELQDDPYYEDEPFDEFEEEDILNA